MARERAVANQLARLLGASNLPIYAVDDRRRVVYCNGACAAWLGASADELIGRRCDYAAADSGDRLTDLAARLCPPPEAFVGQVPIGSFRIVGPSSRPEARSAEYLSLISEAGETVGVLVTMVERHAVDHVQSDVGSDGQLHLRLQSLVNSLRMPYRLERLVGESSAIQLVREQVRIAIEVSANVQVVGPPGSGREHIGRTIHAGERPADAGPLMPLECALLDGELLQATVVAFLHRATEASVAYPATLLLLNCHKLNAEAQAELLAFFRVPTFRLRTIATVRRPLLELAEEGAFLRDLAFRLSTMTIEIPPLSQRREDLPLLCQAFLEDFNARGGKQLSGFTSSVLDHLCSLPWNGDVGELEGVIRDMCERTEGLLVTDADLARRVKLVTSAMRHPMQANELIKLDDFLAEVEIELLQRALQVAKGNKAEAARLLGISRARVIRRTSQLGLE
ncbi:MAG: sigma 54-interacting transcriptional regulator [Planctomycetaceae bacterium]|nr:sigma 54-interacting transcriptional regulator [Planctomycetales bacterium]MCB9920845.1 sigma 54-interacting transcriptional regulator [Planctomycetaceae bacterium]